MRVRHKIDPEARKANVGWLFRYAKHVGRGHYVSYSGWRPTGRWARRVAERRVARSQRASPRDWEWS